MVKIAYKTTNLIRKELFDHMQTLPCGSLTPRPTARS